MATATATKDDDLLIISDDSNDSTTWEIEFNFDFDESSSVDSRKEEVKEKADSTNHSADLEILDEVDTELEIVENSEKNQSEAKSNEDTVANISIDLGSFENEGEDTISETKVETGSTDESNVVEEDFSFGFDDTVKTEEVSNKEETTANEAVMETVDTAVEKEDLNSILSATILKLETRKQSIQTERWGKSSKVQDIKSQIEALQKQVEELEAEMRTLDMEEEKITSNISELEKMKLDPVKNHNSKRVSKK